MRDFVVLEDHREIIGCGALHLYGTHLAEIRSITVDPLHQGRGGGEQLVKALMAEAERHHVACICLFTRKPDFFAQMGFSVAHREDLPDKINKDCCVCPRFDHCRRSRDGSRRDTKNFDSTGSEYLARQTASMISSEVSLSVLLPKGFRFSTAKAGIKASGRPDLAFVEACPGTTAAALFTKNKVVAAPVSVGKASLVNTRGRVRAVIVNSGNANCATGVSGLRACKRVCHEVGRLLDVRSEEVFPSSTGIIGVPLPTQKLLSKLPELVSGKAASDDAFRKFAQAILTTDTRAKLATEFFKLDNKKVTLAGVAKGAGMIHPQLATMLVYIFTDVAASASELRQCLKQACDESFNCISIDGDTSTNDTVLLLASRESGISLKAPLARKKFGDALSNVCQSLARQIVADGEGVQHVIRLHIEQAGIATKL